MLAQAIVAEGLRNVSAEANPMILMHGLEKAVEIIVEEIKKQSHQVKTREQIAEVMDKVAVLENRSSSSLTGRSRPFRTCCRPSRRPSSRASPC